MNRRTAFLIGGGCLLLVLVLILIPAGLIGFFFISHSSSQPTQVTVFSIPPATQTPQIAAKPPLQLTESLPNTSDGTSTNTSSPVGAPDSLPELFKQINPGVVSILVQVTQGGQSGEAAGSGFIIDNKGYIATNNHVVDGADQIYVSFYNSVQASARVVGKDPYSDLAVLQVDSLPKGTVALPLGDSDKAQVGQWVVAIGNPFNIGNSMSLGIVSAVGRIIPASASNSPTQLRFSIPEAIQTDAAINPGNSGGPLVDMSGNVIGINAQIESTTGSNTGVGFSIPINILKLVAPALIEKGNYQWPWLGVTGTDLDPAIVDANHLNVQLGAYILTVVQGSPAEKAGLRGISQQSLNDLQQGTGVPTGGDVVIEVDGQKIDNYDQLLTLIAFKHPGDTVNLVILRDGKQMKLTATLEQRPSNLP